MTACKFSERGTMKKESKSRATEAQKRWAIETAVKWPQIAQGTGGGGYMSGGMGIIYVDADLISRAKKLLDFLND
jgi:hypothetical protein